MIRVVEFIKLHKTLLSLIGSFLFFRLTNLTLLPIFNDEAIYLDWGWRATHEPNHLFYSLYDGRQPLLLWIFGAFQSIIADPLAAGRIVSVVAGLITFFGIYKITAAFFDKKTAVFASLFYISIPIFTFYDRQAVMEASLAAVGVWSCYFFLKLFTSPQLKYALLLGITFGIGFLIKSTALIFVVTTLCVALFLVFTHRTKKEFKKYFLFSLCAMFAVTLLLLIRPDFWNHLYLNNRASLSIAEILRFPLFQWINNIRNNGEIVLFFLTPLVFCSLIGGIILVYKNKTRIHVILLLYFLIGILLQTLLARHTIQRYLIPFLPLSTLFVGYFFARIIQWSNKKGLVLFFLTLSLPFFLSVLQLIKPDAYIATFYRFTRFSDIEYISGYTSGYSAIQAVEYLKKISKDKKIIAATAVNSGNPESAVNVYFQNDTNVITAYMSEDLLGPVGEFDCLKTQYPYFFVTRNTEVGAFKKFVTPITSFKNPYGSFMVRIYKQNDTCQGKTATMKLEK